MNQSIIEVKNIGKKYNITHQRGGYVSLRDVLTNIIKRPFAFLKYKAKEVTGLQKKEEFWAIKDINFNVKKGEVIGIIGRNGAGKSTLLKILSQITPPTTGEIRIRGRVGSLLEVGTGFHAELSGRENIFLNGAILGMTKKEVVSKFDEIVAFSGVEKFIDTPVKHYSSGMYVRLAFSVAAHMEPDILIVDEVLAVGDAEFQKKCLGKMDEISKDEGRTILFVSHNLTAIEKLCTKCIVLKDSTVDFFGDTKEAINRYMSYVVSNKNGMLHNSDIKRYGPENLSRFINIETLDKNNRPLNIFKIGDSLKVRLDFELKSDVSNFEIGFSINSMMNTNLATFLGEWEGLPNKLNKGHHQITCNIEKLYCFPGNYGITAWIKRKGDSVDQQIDFATQFSVISSDITGFEPDFRYQNMGVYHKSSWQINT